jgi:hypothetical protein
MFNTIYKNIEKIETNKELVLDSWMNYQIVKETLCANTLKHDFFREKFASKVFDFAIGVVKSKNEVGDCPVIGVMLMLFKKKNIPLADVFMICVHLKNALLHFLYKESLLDDDMIREISILMDYNFAGVIKEYALLYYHDAYIPKNCDLTKDKSKKESTTQTDKSDTSTEINIDKKHSTSAKTYLKEIELDMEMIHELDELESDALNAIDSGETINRNSLDEGAHLFEQYAKVLYSMYEFEELAYTLTILKELLISTELSTMSEETNYMITIYLKAIISDLQSWRMAIFITKEAEDIHYLDKTLLSSIAQLQITLMPQDQSNEDEIEFF